MRKAVFFDRDGIISEAVVIAKKPYPPSFAGSVTIKPGIHDVLARLGKMGYLTLVVTNQPDVGRRIQTKEEVEKINTYLKDELPINDFYVCYHSPEDGCTCRKPNIGLFLKAGNEYAIEFYQSWMVGDRWMDMEAGKKAGCRTIFLDYDYDEKQPEDKYVDFRIRSIPEIMEVINGNTDLR